MGSEQRAVSIKGRVALAVLASADHYSPAEACLVRIYSTGDARHTTRCLLLHAFAAGGWQGGRQKGQAKRASVTGGVRKGEAGGGETGSSSTKRCSIFKALTSCRRSQGSGEVCTVDFGRECVVES